MAGRPVGRGTFHAVLRGVRRGVRAHFYRSELRALWRKTEAAVARHEAVCATSRAWISPSAARLVKPPARLYRRLWSATVPVVDPAVRSRHRRLEQLYVAVSRCARDEPAIDPLTSEAALALQGKLALRTFHELLGVTLNARQVAAVGQYGNLTTAIRDLLAQSGFSERVSDFAPVPLDLRSFALFAAIRHQRLIALAQQEPSPRRFFDLAQRWSRTRVAATRRDWRQLDKRQQLEWRQAGRASFDLFHGKVWTVEMRADAQYQSDYALHCAHEIQASALERLADLAEHICIVDPVESDSARHAASFIAALDAVTLLLADTVTRCRAHLEEDLKWRLTTHSHESTRPPLRHRPATARWF